MDHSKRQVGLLRVLVYLLQSLHLYYKAYDAGVDQETNYVYLAGMYQVSMLYKSINAR